MSRSPIDPPFEDVPVSLKPDHEHLWARASVQTYQSTCLRGGESIDMTMDEFDDLPAEQRVEVHGLIVEDIIASECYDGTCEHEEDQCPPVPTEVCKACRTYYEDGDMVLLKPWAEVLKHGHDYATVEEALLDATLRGNDVREWPEDEAEAYRTYRWDEGSLAARAVLVTKLMARVHQSYVKPDYSAHG